MKLSENGEKWPLRVVENDATNGVCRSIGPAHVLPHHLSYKSSGSDKARGGVGDPSPYFWFRGVLGGARR